METIFDTLASESFAEKALLLILGALLTGLLVPVVKARMDSATFERQKTFEAHLARQSDVIKAQTQFLSEFSNYIWEYHMISQRVSYARLSEDEEAYQRAIQEYQDSMWESLHNIRSAIGAAGWFCSDTAYQALLQWYDEWFLKRDMKLRNLIDQNPGRQEWSEYHNKIHAEASKSNYELLRVLAEDFGLRSIVEEQDASESSGDGRGRSHRVSEQADEA